MALSSTYQSTGLPLLSTLYEPPPKHLISVLEELADAWAWVRERSQQAWPYAQFPQGCPWPLAQLLDAEFWPALDTFTAREKEPDDAARASLDVDRA